MTQSSSEHRHPQQSNVAGGSTGLSISEEISRALNSSLMAKRQAELVAYLAEVQHLKGTVKCIAGADSTGGGPQRFHHQAVTKFASSGGGFAAYSPPGVVVQTSAVASGMARHNKKRREHTIRREDIPNGGLGLKFHDEVNSICANQDICSLIKEGRILMTRTVLCTALSILGAYVFCVVVLLTPQLVVKSTS